VYALLLIVGSKQFQTFNVGKKALVGLPRPTGWENIRGKDTKKIVKAKEEGKKKREKNC
jgi:hypothetical protein